MAPVLRYMADHSAAPHTVAGLARMAKLSPYHFLRSFKTVTGVTPHQWLLRARLRAAAEKLAATKAPVTEIALDVGFEDLSNFTRTFRAEFGASPREYQASGLSSAKRNFLQVLAGTLAYLSPHKRRRQNHAQPCFDRRARYRPHQALL